MKNKPENKYPVIILLGVLTGIVYFLFPILQDGRSIKLYMIIYASAFFLMLITYFTIKKQNSITIRNVYLIIIFGIIFRAILIPSNISTSDDVYRYIWEGKVVVNGENPFLYSPDSEKLNYLRTENYPKLVTYPNMTTIYPGAAQTVFALAYLISGESEVGLKLIYLISEIITLIILLSLLRKFKLPEYNLILYAWLPLPIMEYFINSHIDVVGIMFFVVSLYLLYKEKNILSALFFALAVSVKLYALIALPIILIRTGIKRGFIYAIIVLSVLLITMLPYLPAGEKLFSSLTAYASSWSFNGSVYSLLRLIFHNGYTAHALSFILLAFAVITFSLFSESTIRGIFYVWIAYIIFTPTLYPWYLGWIAVLIPFIRFNSVLALLFLINFSNVTPLQKEWTEFTWVYLIEYVPFFLLIIYDIMRVKKEKIIVEWDKMNSLLEVLKGMLKSKNSPANDKPGS